MAVITVNDYVRHESGSLSNYDLFKSIESKNFLEANKIIQELFKINNQRKAEFKSFVSLVLKYYILTENTNLEKFYHDNKNNLMKRDILLYCNYIYHTNYEKSLENFKYLVMHQSITEFC